MLEIIESIPTAASEENPGDRHERAEKAAHSIELTQEETDYLGGEQIRMDISCLPVINFALQQNGMPIIRSIRIENNTPYDLFDVVLNISSNPAFCKTYQKLINYVPAKSQFELKEIKLVLDADYLAAITEKVAGTFTIELLSEEQSLCSEVVDISVLAFNEWHGSRIYPELLASFVMPNHPDITRITSRAASFLEEWTRDPSLDAYQTKNTNRVLLQAAAIYKALQEQNIVYAEPPASFEYSGQRVRLCDEVLAQKMGTCLDLSLLYASCLEAIGLFPLLILKKGHIFAGVWLEDSTFAESVQDDVSLLTKRLAEGSRVLAVVECTLFTAGKHTPFDSACANAEYQLQEKGAFDCFIDVHRARLSRIAPLPQRVLSADGWHVERPNVTGRDLTSAPQSVAAPLDIRQTEAQTFSKKVLWERKLLDLGMRNTLLNMRLTKSMIPLISSSLDDLEDALADGGDFTIYPRPAEWAPAGGRQGFEALHVIEGYKELLQSEFKRNRLRSALTETELANATKALYRSAKTDMEENGANTLYMALGLLKWFETDRSTQPRYAPILLLPIEMVRKSAAEGYIIRLRDDETQLNITLLEKLRQDFSIEITGLDPLPTDDKGIDTRLVFATFRQRIMNQKHWDVLESACLGIFSFSQFVMWNDIHNRADDLARNKIVKSLMDGHLTWQAEDMHIEGQVPEDDVLLPIPADASQLYAIEAAAEGKSFVLHGPPGTGKSQTITALIANVLSKGKTVLFVAEKMAALEVVQKRLKKIGLAPFCLELHSNKAKKKDVLEQLRQASEVTKYQSSGEYAESLKRIAALRENLNKYAVALHREQPCGKTIFSLINEYQTYENAADIKGFSMEFIRTLTSTNLYDHSMLVDSLVTAGRGTGHPHDHPLKNVRCKTYSQQLRHLAAEKTEQYDEKLRKLNESIFKLSNDLKQLAPKNFDEIGLLVYTAQCLTEFESYPAALVDAKDLDGYIARIRSLAEHGININTYKEKLAERWDDAFFQQNGAELMANYNSQSVKWFLGRSIGLKQLCKQLSFASKKTIEIEQLGKDLADLEAYQKEKAAADELLKGFGTDLGDLVKGEDTDWHQLADLAAKAKDTANKAKYISAGDDFRLSYGTDRHALADAHELLDNWAEMLKAKDDFYSLLDISAEAKQKWIAGEIELCNHISSNTDKMREWVIWNQAADNARNAGLWPVVIAYENGLEHDDVMPAYKKTINKLLAMDAIEADETLNLFSGNDFNNKIAQFRKIDKELTELAKNEIYCKLASQVPNFTTASVGSSETSILQRAIRSGGRGTSIRKLFEQIPNLLPKLCPCMLMSPISVAQYLDPNRKPFDIVVFDEASQLPTSKAVGTLARGENAIIVGDPKQMPPTSFFASNSTDEEHIEEEDMESILDDCLALNMPQTHLLWHYRSRHESLIAFSNSQFYENKLYTFPSVNDRESHVRLVHVDGMFERGGKRTNRAEAEAIVGELKRRCHDPVLRERSVGVVTFNISQQNLIDDLLTEACKDDPQLEEWAYNSKEPIFIKNLENVQGDERDVILFSIGYGPDQSGKVHMNFGPLNKEGGWRRLNVAVSRARYDMIVFATLTPDQINLSRTSAQGVAALKEFMEFAASNTLLDTEESIQQKPKANTGIAEAICSELLKHGYETDQSVGESAYKVDVAVVDPKNPDQYLLGILLDGQIYKTAKTTRDRELAQINVLEDLGWHITRVWSMDWWDNSSRELERILREIHEIEKQKAESKAEEKPAPVEINKPHVDTQQPKNVLIDVVKVKQNNTPPNESTTHSGEMNSKNTQLKGSASNIEEKASLDGTPLKGMVVNTEQQTKPVRTYKIKKLPYSPMSAETFIEPGRRHLDDVKYRVLNVLDEESPISEGLLTRRVVQSFGIARAGNRIQNYMGGVYRVLRLKCTKQGSDIIFWKDSQDPRTFMDFRANGEGECKRDAKDIPWQEAMGAVCQALEEQFSLPEEDLIRAAANLMGITRIGSAVYELFSHGIQMAVKFNRIQKAENGNWVLVK